MTAPLTPTGRINAQHTLSEAIERCRALANALDPRHGVAVIRRYEFATDIERIVGPLITMQLTNLPEKERAEVALLTAMRRAFTAGVTPKRITMLMIQAAAQVSAPPTQPLAVASPPPAEDIPYQQLTDQAMGHVPITLEGEDSD